MATGPRALDPPDYPLQLQWVDLEAYRESNTGVDFVHSFDSEKPGLHVMVNALTHGNELCGMVVVRRLLDAGLRPLAGRLTLSFANVEAYRRFGPDARDTRFVERDFNRLWRDDLLQADKVSCEARRANAMRPIVATVDRLLDLHSTWHALEPFFVVPRLARARRLADDLALPPRQLLLPDFRHEGYHLIDYGAFAAPDTSAVGLIAECGQHFARASADMAWQVTLRFLAHLGCIAAAPGGAVLPQAAAPESVLRYEIVEPVIARTDRLRLACSYAGFVRFDKKGDIAAFDGDEPVRAPFDGAMLLAPRPSPGAGQQAFAWGRAVAG